ncbi:MarC family protein [Celerinatantimonas sp. YJH-8]|uniref:MarC family protein n=1 Tax=Celerinatantimonas sp. YJH-8 TaxID=3228714 RepID=UPI0038C2CE73
MDHFVAHLTTVFMSFFAIMNPIANVPIFLGLTANDDSATTKLIALRAVVIAFILVCIFTLAGHWIFQLFGITLPAFRLVGGVLVGTIGFQMLHGNQSSMHQLPSEDNDACREAVLSVSIFPLAMPILAGPGTIVTALNYAAHGGLLELFIILSSFAALCLITFVFFVFGQRFVAVIGSGALGVITRIMGLILAVIGAQMIIEGIQGAFPNVLS